MHTLRPASFGEIRVGKTHRQKYNAAHLRIDTIEEGLRDLCDFKVEGEG